MKKKDYYELLEISPTASTMDIIHAYRRAKLAFQEDSLAAYTLFSDTDMQELREQIDEAYHTLSDSEKRREYDAMRSRFAKADKHSENNQHMRPQLHADDSNLQQRIATATKFPGAFLCEIRELQNISIQAIAERTRISRQYLRAIEAEDTSHFPEPVYLKGYLRQYAHEIGLDPESVVRGYPPLAAAPQAEEPPTCS